MIIRPSLGLVTLALTIAGCGPSEAPQAPAADIAPPPPAAAPAAPTAPAVTRKASPAGAMAYIIAPANGTTVTSPVRVVFGLKGAGVAPAGVDLPNTGHHHLLIDTRLTNFDQPIPADAQHVHFGLGQTETTVQLAPGRHTLQLVLGDNMHVPHNPPIVSEVITIEVTN